MSPPKKKRTPARGKTAPPRKRKRQPTKQPTRSAVRATAESQPFTNLVRLQKILAAAGVGSRRECETLISEGRVMIGNRVVEQLGTRVDPTSQKIFVDGEPLPQPKLVYFAVHKPQGVVSTSSDEWGRARVTDMVPPNAGRVFTVGRLDINSEGLILLTNDGALANRLTHPRYGIEKTYHVQVAGRPEKKTLEALKQGVQLAEGIARVERVRLKSHHKKSSMLEMVLTEGRNREIRRMLAVHGHKVQRLRRVAIGPLRMGELPPDSYRPLTRDEVTSLREAAEQATPTRPTGPSRKRFSSSKSRVKTSGKPTASRRKTSTKPAESRRKAKKPAATEEFHLGASKSDGAVIGDDGPKKKKATRRKTSSKPGKFGSAKRPGGKIVRSKSTGGKRKQPGKRGRGEKS